MSVKHVAEQVGISPVTVSRALNDPQKVHPDTLAKIRQACDRIGYRPRVIPNRLNSVSIVIPEAGEVQTGDSVLLSELVIRLNERDMHVSVATLDNLDRMPAVFHKAFIAIMRDMDEANTKRLRQYADRVAFVAINDMNETIGTKARLVGSDHVQGMSMAMEHLFAKGHRRIAYLGDSLTRRGIRDRHDTYVKLMRERRCYDANLISNYGPDVVPESVRRLCDAGVTAIVVIEPQLTPKVLHSLSMLAKCVPQDVSIVAFQFGSKQALDYVPVTVLVQPLDALARRSVELICDARARRTRKHLLPFEFIDRGSVRSL